MAEVQIQYAFSEKRHTQRYPHLSLTYGQGEKKQPTNMEKENVRKFTATEWCLERLVRMQHEYGHHYPELLQFAQIVSSAPITNAWPQHVASAITCIKTRLQNYLKNDMLVSLLQISVNPNLDGGGKFAPPSWFFEHSSETVRSSKMKLSEFDFFIYKTPF